MYMICTYIYIYNIMISFIEEKYGSVPCEQYHTWFKSTSGPFYKDGLTLSSTWRTKHIHHIGWDKITDLFPNFKSAAIEV